MLFARFKPGKEVRPRFSPVALQRASGNATQSSLVFYESKTKYAVFTFKRGGSRNNGYRATLYAAGSNRFNFKLFNADGSVVSQKTVTTGMVDMPAGIAGSAKLGPLLNCTVVGTFSTAPTLSGGTAFANASRFGRGRR